MKLFLKDVKKLWDKHQLIRFLKKQKKLYVSYQLGFFVMLKKSKYRTTVVKVSGSIKDYFDGFDPDFFKKQVCFRDHNVAFLAQLFSNHFEDFEVLHS